MINLENKLWGKIEISVWITIPICYRNKVYDKIWSPVRGNIRSNFYAMRNVIHEKVWEIEPVPLTTYTRWFV